MIIAAWSFIPAEAPDPVMFVVLASLSALLLSVSKGGFGGGFGVLAVPIMIIACGGEHTKLAAGIMLPVLILCDVVGLARWRGRWRVRPVALLIPGVAVGIGLGWVALLAMGRLDTDAAGRATKGHTSDACLMLMIGVIAVVFVFVQLWRARRGELKAFRPTLLHGSIFGSIAGFTSTLAHAAGPVTGMYFLPQKLPKDQFVATIFLSTTAGNTMKLVPYIALGMLNYEAWMASVILVPAVVFGTLLGAYMNGRVNPKAFFVIVYGLLGVAGVHFTIKATRVLLNG